MTRGEKERLEQAASKLRMALAHNLRRQMLDDPNIRTQQQLADRAGVDQTTVSRALRGKHAVTLDQLARLSAATGVMAYKLLLFPPDGPNPPSDAADEGQQLLGRLARVSKKHTSKSTDVWENEEDSQRGSAGGHMDRTEPGPRKVRRTEDNNK